MSFNVPLLDLRAQHAELQPELGQALDAVIESGAFINGPQVAEFEHTYADFCGVSHCIGVASGTAALEIALRALGIGPGDEVLVPAMTFVASAAAVSWAGAVPVLVDVDRDTGLIDFEAAQGRVSKRTKAVIAVDLWGQAVDAVVARDFADANGLFLVEDAAQAQGASSHGKRAGAIGDVAGHSFYPGKNLGALGDAGAVTTSNEAVAEAVHQLINHGSSPRERTLHERIGTTARLDTLQAAALTVKLSRLERWNERRREHAAAYDRAFAGLDGVRPIVNVDSSACVYHYYVVRLPDRDAVARRLAEWGIGTGVHYPRAIHQNPGFAELAHPELKAAETLATEILSLPVSAQLTDDQREAVIAAVAEAAQR